MPTASGTDMTLVGPRPITLSELMPRSWRWISRIGMPDRSAERDEPAHRLDVGHDGAARLAEGHEDLERLALVVFGDGDVERAERRLDPAHRSALEQIGPGPLLAPLQILGLELVHQLAEPLVLRVKLDQLSGYPRRSRAARSSAVSSTSPRSARASALPDWWRLPAPSCAVEPVESTCMSRLPSR